jgi:ATP-dependent DNA helicase RecG
MIAMVRTYDRPVFERSNRNDSVCSNIIELESSNMSVEFTKVSVQDADKIRLIDEGQYGDIKGLDISPARLTRSISAFANTDGGELWVGISNKERIWSGFSNIEAANGHLQIFEKLFPLGSDVLYDFLVCDAYPGLVLHVQVNKTRAIMYASDGIAYVRRAAGCFPCNSPEKFKQLEYEKGIASFETHPVSVPKDIIVTSNVTAKFMESVVPQAEAEPWLRKNLLIRDDKPTVAAIILFAEEPQAALPKYCGVKVYRYKTTDREGTRETLAFDPRTVEGWAYDQIKRAVGVTREIAESIPRLALKRK